MMWRAMLLVVAWCSVANAQDLNQFFKGEDWETTSSYKAPSGRYRVRIPSGMTPQTDQNDPDLVFMAGDTRGVQVSILIKRVKVTPGAAASQLMLTTRDNHLAKLPNFSVMQTRKAKIADRNCVVMTGRYDYQANKGHPQVIEQAYVIDGSDGFIIHLEVPAYAYNDVQDRIREVYESFRPLSVAGPSGPKP